MSYSVEAEGIMERANPMFTIGSPDHAGRLGAEIDRTLAERDRRIAELEAALMFGIGANLNELAACGLPLEWSPDSGTGRMVAALGIKDRAEWERRNAGLPPKS